jgi:hypothetical protein
VSWGKASPRSPDDPGLPGHDKCAVYSAERRAALLFINVRGEASQTVPKTKNKLHLDVRMGDDDVAALVAKLRERGELDNQRASDRD